VTQDAKTRDAIEIEIEDLFGDAQAIHACPFHHYDAVREQPGLVYSPTMEAYLVTRLADAREVLSDASRFSNKVPFGRVAMRKEREATKELMAKDQDISDLVARLKPRRAPMLASADPPIHLRQRRLLQNLFSPKYTRSYEDYVTALADSFIDRFPDGEVEFVAALSVPLPVEVIATLMGVEPARGEDFKRWSNSFFFATGSKVDESKIATAIREQVELFDYFTAQIADRRANPRDDLVTKVIEARQAGDEPFTDDEVVAVLSQMLVAGNETTTGLLSSCMLHLARRPELIDRLHAEPERIADFCEEVLRLECPAKANTRTVLVDTTVGGFPVEAGSQIMVLHVAANRDPAAFKSEVDLEARNKARHVGFGNGEHFCLGAELARMEARVVVGAMVRRFRRLSLKPGHEPEYIPLNTTRALDNLYLCLEPR